MIDILAPSEMRNVVDQSIGCVYRVRFLGVKGKIEAVLPESAISLLPIRQTRPLKSGHSVPTNTNTSNSAAAGAHPAMTGKEPDWLKRLLEIRKRVDGPGQSLDTGANTGNRFCRDAYADLLVTCFVDALAEAYRSAKSF
eukprot:jgi/Hompol1/2327/HPOL_002906-RA